MITLETVARLDNDSLGKALKERELSRSGRRFIKVVRLAKYIASEMAPADVEMLADKYRVEPSDDRDALVASVISQTSDASSVTPEFTTKHIALCQRFFIDVQSVQSAARKDPVLMAAILKNTEGLFDTFVAMSGETQLVEVEFGLLVSLDPRILLATPRDFGRVLEVIAEQHRAEAISPSVKRDLVVRFTRAITDTGMLPQDIVQRMADTLATVPEMTWDVVKRYPQLIGIPQDKLRDKADAFKRLFRLSDSQFVRILRNNPRILSYPSSTIEKKMREFVAILGLDEDMMSSMIVSQPSLISLSPDALQQRAAFFRKYLDLTDEEAQHIFRHFHGILSLHEERNIKPKLDFLINVCGCTKEDIKLSPFSLKHGLWTRLIPRYDLYMQFNIPLTLNNLTLSNAKTDELLKKPKGFTSRFHAAWTPEISHIKERPEYKESFLKKPKRSV